MKSALKRPDPHPLSECYKGRTLKSGTFCKNLFPDFLEPVSAALLLLETAVITLFWVMIQLEAFLTPLLATVLQLEEQCNQRLPN